MVERDEKWVGHNKVGHDQPTSWIKWILPSKLGKCKRGRQQVEYEHDLLSHARIIENELHSV